jgi:GTP-binding protein
MNTVRLQTENIEPLLRHGYREHVPAPKIEEGTTQMLITSIDFSFTQVVSLIGRCVKGETLKEGQNVTCLATDGSMNCED